MSKLKREDILQLWVSVTDFGETWNEKIQELQARIDELKRTEDYEMIKEDLEALTDELDELQKEIEDSVEDALEGSLSLDDLSELFRDYGDRLLMLEQELIELELEPEEYEEYWDEEEEEGGEEF
ncbi:MAG: hypothetical protein ABIL77_02380 [candidate division WOR-3 bacterium]